MKRLFCFFLFFVTFPIFANSVSPSLICDKAPPVSDANFCSAFKSIAICHCLADGGVPGMCGSMDDIYRNMVAYFGSQKRACDWQQKKGSEIRTSSQECMDDWDCYRTGGNHNGLCSGTGLKCE